MKKQWHIEFSDHALRSLKKLDKTTASLIIGYIEKNLVNCDNPRSLGKPLVSNHKGKWRYRVGDYRLLCFIEDQKVLIVVIEIGHRSDIYTIR